MKMQYQVKQLVQDQLIINKSKFISFLFPITSLKEVKNILNKIKEEYSDATHICYSYILDADTFKFYDDGEPSSTAGAPIYQVLKNNNLIYTMCIVIRYFGGIKLGVGGLIKAYTNSALLVLQKANIDIYEELINILVTTSYSCYERLDYFLKSNNIEILKKDFNEQITIECKLNKKNLRLLEDSFANYIKIEIL